MKLNTIPMLLTGMTLFASQSLSASSPVNYELDTEFTGGSLASGNPIVTLEDNGDDVKFILDINSLTEPEHVKEWYFNLDPNLDASLLTISNFTSGTGLVKTPDLIAGDLSPSVGAAGLFDFVFEFSNKDRFEFVSGGDAWVEIDLSYSGLNLDIEHFLYSSTGGSEGSFFSAAHVGGIGPGGRLSGKIGDWDGATPVPEPSTYLILGTMLAAVGFLRRKTLRSQQAQA